MDIRCTSCRQPYPDEGFVYRCQRCGGIFDQVETIPYNPLQVDSQKTGLWRFRPALGLPGAAPEVSLGEGNTPLAWAEAFGREVAFKLEFLNPTGSYKDRGSAVLLSFLKSRQVQSAIEDSSGNAGASFAAYAARAGISARVFVPDSASGPKRRQIEAYGAEIVRVMGPRSNAAEAALQAARGGAVYASHAWLPFVLAGYATLAYEILEDLGQPPGTLIAPAGQGNLLLAIGRGFVALQAAGVIPHLPRLVGVQARACAPLWAVNSFGAAGMGFVTEAKTLAEGVAVRYPMRGDAVLQVIAGTGGTVLAVDEEAILPGRDELAHRGLYVEPTSAIVWDALGQLDRAAPDPVVVVLTGSGLKYQG